LAWPRWRLLPERRADKCWPFRLRRLPKDFGLFQSNIKTGILPSKNPSSKYSNLCTYYRRSPQLGRQSTGETRQTLILSKKIFQSCIKFDEKLPIFNTICIRRMIVSTKVPAKRRAPWTCAASRRRCPCRHRCKWYNCGSIRNTGPKNVRNIRSAELWRSVCRRAYFGGCLPIIFQSIKC
jgi:hypothetical protein